MKKSTLFSVLALVGHVLFLVIGFFLMFNVIDMIGEVSEGIGGGIQAGALAVLNIIFGMGYSVVAALSIIVEIIVLKLKKWYLPIICLVFDVLLTAASVVVALNVLMDIGRYQLITPIFVIVTFVISLAVLAANILSLVCLIKDRRVNVEVNNE